MLEKLTTAWQWITATRMRWLTAVIVLAVLFGMMLR